MISYSAAISACEKAGRCDEALSLLREMPDVTACNQTCISYSAAIQACAAAQQPDEALRLFKEALRSVEPRLCHLQCGAGRCRVAAAGHCSRAVATGL